MGVSLEVYRCRIGSFHGSCVSSYLIKGVSTINGQGLNLVLLAAGILFVLLLIGNVEANPGPPSYKHTCRVCFQVFTSASLYCAHVTLHPKYKAGNLIPCSVRGCSACITSLNSFKNHYSLYHGTKVPSESSDSTSFKCASCPVANCSGTMSSRQEYSTHMEDHLSKKVAFNCFLKGCPATYLSNVALFRTHNSRYHRITSDIPFVDQVPEQCIQSTSSDSSLSHMDFADNASDADCAIDDPPQDEDDAELYPLHAVKDELARFYLRLEAVELLPTSTVQLIADEIKLLSEITHHILKASLKKQLQKRNLEANIIQDVIQQTFRSEPIFNVHHKGLDVQQLGTDHLRQSYWSQQFKFVAPKEIHLGESVSGKKKCAQFISIRKSLQVMLEDPDVKKAVQYSFSHPKTVPNLDCLDAIFQDFTDGSVFNDHIRCADHDEQKCLQLFLFQDGFDPNAFSSGNYKPLAFYYCIGNLPPQLRTQLNKIQLAFMVLEQDLKNSLADELNDFDRMSHALRPLIDELIDLKTNGIEIDGEIIPVCLMFLVGDSLGQNMIGRYVTNFSTSSFSCRFCVMSKLDFQTNPDETRSMRTPQEYNDYVKISRTKWLFRRNDALERAKSKGKKVAARCSAPAKKTMMRAAVSRYALSKMTCIHYRGVKYRPSPFNRPELNFHAVNHQPPCLAHDLFEGVVKRVVPLILKHFIEKKKWFDLELLNRRIMAFKPKGSDALDKPKPFKKLEKLSGNAVENWNFVRLAPFIFGDLIKDINDPYWKKFLLLKKLVEYVCAPKITMGQIGHLQVLISEFVLLVKELLTCCLIPKLHYLCHYPALIMMFGPLIRLFTLRFESKHAFFKRVIRSCKNYINITRTMARKYVCRFAYDNSFGAREDIVWGQVHALVTETEEMKQLLINQLQEMKKVTYFGTTYCETSYLILDDLGGLSIKIGCIRKIVMNRSGDVSLVLEEMEAENSLQGYYIIKGSLSSFSLHLLQDLPDYYPLQSYVFQGRSCLSLKHSVPFIY